MPWTAALRFQPFVQDRQNSGAGLIRRLAAKPLPDSILPDIFVLDTCPIAVRALLAIRRKRCHRARYRDDVAVSNRTGDFDFWFQKAPVEICWRDR